MHTANVAALAQSATDLYASGQFSESLAVFEQVLCSDLNDLTDVQQCRLYNTYCLVLLYTSNYVRCHDVVVNTYNKHHNILHHSHKCTADNQFTQHNDCDNDVKKCSLHCSANAYVIKRERNKLKNLHSHATLPKTLTCHNTTMYDKCDLYHVICELVLLKILLNHIYPISCSRSNMRDWLSIPEHWSLTVRRKLKHNTLQLYSYLQMIHRLAHFDLKLAVNIEQHSNILHVIGDSHMLTLVNRQLLLNNTQYHCKSYLIPGAKAYHIASCNNAKSSLQRSLYKLHIDRLPLNSTCMIVCGEIDCRRAEGILVAVNKGKFHSIDDALHTTVHTYVQQLIQDANRRHMKVLYIHPVRPPYISDFKIKKAIKYQQRKHRERSATGETDKMLELVYNVALLIHDWNKQLQVEINTQQSHIEPSKRILQYIDIFEQLRDTDADATQHTALQYLVREVYTLEGLHLNTQYIPLIESAISKIHIENGYLNMCTARFCDDNL